MRNTNPHLRSLTYTSLPFSRVSTSITRNSAQNGYHLSSCIAHSSMVMTYARSPLHVYQQLPKLEPKGDRRNRWKLSSRLLLCLAMLFKTRTSYDLVSTQTAIMVWGIIILILFYTLSDWFNLSLFLWAKLFVMSVQHVWWGLVLILSNIILELQGWTLVQSCKITLSMRKYILTAKYDNRCKSEKFYLT